MQPEKAKISGNDNKYTYIRLELKLINLNYSFDKPRLNIKFLVPLITTKHNAQNLN